METCKISKKCGSCDYMGKSYEEQLRIMKDDMVKLFPGKSVEDVLGAKDPYHYRNKVIVAFNRNYEYGFYEENSHRIIPYRHCLLHEDITDQVIQKIQFLLKKYHVSIYDEDRRRGFLRHVLIRRAVKTDQMLVVLVVNEKEFKGSKNFCNTLVKSFPVIKSIVMNINTRKTSIVLGNEEKTLYGKGYIEDELLGNHYKISAKSFYQINHDQCEVLYNKAISLLKLTGNEVVLDAYSGIGTIGMSLAKRVKQVISVELNKDACKDAMYNCKRNKLSNVKVINEDATKFMVEASKEGGKLDVLIMDPPRSGSTKEFIEASVKLKPKQILYISCGPDTQARDLKLYAKLGYTCHTVYPVDMFPFTKHVETVVLMSKK